MDKRIQKLIKYQFGREGLQETDRFLHYLLTQSTDMYDIKNQDHYDLWLELIAEGKARRLFSCPKHFEVLAPDITRYVFICQDCGAEWTCEELANARKYKGRFRYPRKLEEKFILLDENKTTEIPRYPGKTNQILDTDKVDFSQWVGKEIVFAGEMDCGSDGPDLVLTFKTGEAWAVASGIGGIFYRKLK